MLSCDSQISPMITACLLIFLYKKRKHVLAFFIPLLMMIPASGQNPNRNIDHNSYCEIVERQQSSVVDYDSSL